MRFNWTEDELILALDLYLRTAPDEPDQDSREIGELQAVLQAMPVHPVADRDANFRTRDAVHLKLMNYRALDPNRPSRGMANGGPATARIWDDYGHHPELVFELANQIRTTTLELKSEPMDDAELDVAADEGGLTMVVHQRRERNRVLAKKKRAEVLRKHGSLRCEACGLDGKAKYGDEVGDGVFECHHRTPLNETGPTVTRLSDLVIVCATCHRAVHRIRPTMSINELRARLARVSVK